MQRKLKIVLVLGLAASAAGCLISGTKIFEIDVTENGGPIDLSGAATQTISVDLTENDVYLENQEDIKRVDRVGFEATAHVNNATAAAFSISYRRSGGAWAPLLSDVQIGAGASAANPRRIGYEESESRIANFEAFRAAVAAGDFELQLESGNGAYDLTVSQLILIVTFTVGL